MWLFWEMLACGEDRRRPVPSPHGQKTQRLTATVLTGHRPVTRSPNSASLDCSPWPSWQEGSCSAVAGLGESRSWILSQAQAANSAQSSLQQVLVDEGFDRIETLMDIQEEDLVALNVKRGHRRRLQRELAWLRGKPSLFPSSFERISCPLGLRWSFE